MSNVPYVPVDAAASLEQGDIVYSYGQTLDGEELHIGQLVKLDPGQGEAACVKAFVVSTALSNRGERLWICKVANDRPLLFVDCKCADCRNSKQAHYYMIGRCDNCGTDQVVIAYHKGERAFAVNCPTCLVKALIPKRLASNEELLRAKGSID